MIQWSILPMPWFLLTNSEYKPDNGFICSDILIISKEIIIEFTHDPHFAISANNDRSVVLPLEDLTCVDELQESLCAGMLYKSFLYVMFLQLNILVITYLECEQT